MLPVTPTCAQWTEQEQRAALLRILSARMEQICLERNIQNLVTILTVQYLNVQANRINVINSHLYAEGKLLGKASRLCTQKWKSSGQNDSVILSICQNKKKKQAFDKAL